MISTIKLKKYMVDASIFGIIVDKFCHKKKLYPIILFKIDKNLKRSFHCTILSFDLTIYL